MSLPRILVTGFGPFPGVSINPSAILATSLARSKRLERFARIHSLILPTTYAEAAAFPRIIEAERPDGVLMFGLAGKTSWIRIETRGRNRASQFHVDASGRKPSQTLLPGKPSLLPMRAPVQRLLKAARSTGIDARLSLDAGGYICNAAIFHALQGARRTPLIAFVHIPWPHTQKRGKDKLQGPAMQAIVRAGEAILIAFAQATRLNR
jgi:pyroglutamyl-peptidase